MASESLALNDVLCFLLNKIGILAVKQIRSVLNVLNESILLTISLHQRCVYLRTLNRWKVQRSHLTYHNDATAMAVSLARGRYYFFGNLPG